MHRSSLFNEVGELIKPQHASSLPHCSELGWLPNSENDKTGLAEIDPPQTGTLNEVTSAMLQHGFDRCVMTRKDSRIGDTRGCAVQCPYRPARLVGGPIKLTF